MHKVPKGVKVLKELWVLKGLKEPKELKVDKVHKDYQVLKEV